MAGNNVTLTLNGASQQLLKGNGRRGGLIITAPAAAVTLFLGNGPAVAGTGITIPPNTVFSIPGYTGPVFIIGTNLQVVSATEY